MGRAAWVAQEAYLFPMVQALVIVLEHGRALLLAGIVFVARVHDVAR